MRAIIHTLTITATDLSGNTVQKTVSVVVADPVGIDGEIIADTQ